MYTHFKERSHSKILFHIAIMAHNTGICLIWFTMNSLQQIIPFIFSFVFLGHKDEKNHFLEWRTRSKTKKEEGKKRTGII